VANINDWPWPRLFVTPYRHFLVTKFAGYNIYYIYEAAFDGSDWDVVGVANLYGLGEISFIEFADFGEFYVVCVKTSTDEFYTYYRDLSETTELEYLVSQSEPAFATACNFNGQLVAGNVTGSAPWDDCSQRSVIWSAIGSVELNPANAIVAGMYQKVDYSDSQIHRVAMLGKQVVVYTDLGNLLLTPSVVGNSFTFGESVLTRVGIRNPNYVAGDFSVHGFIGSDNEFWIVEAGGKISRRGYSEFIAEIVESELPVIVSYLSKERQFYVSNGALCLVINDYGAYHTHQMVSSITRVWDGQLLGTWDDNDDETALIVSDTLDFNSRGIKSVESITADFSMDSEAEASLSVDFRYDQRASFTSLQDQPCNPSGESRIGVAAANFRLRFTLSDYTNAEFRYMLANVKYSDQRFKRGTVPGQLEVGR